MSTPEELLCSRRWRLVHGRWMLWGILSAGLLACVGWLYIGVKSKNQRFLIVGGVLLAYSIVYLALSSSLDLPGKDETGTASQETRSTWMGGVAAVVWIASSIGAWFANRKWLVWRAHHDKSTPWYRTATSTSAPIAPNRQQVAANVDNAFAGISAASTTQFQPGWYPVPGTDQERYHDGSRYTEHARPNPASRPLDRSWTSPPPAIVRSVSNFRTLGGATPSGALDLNSATAAQIAELPGLDPATAAHVISVRTQVGGFSDPTDLVTRAGVKPHVFGEIQGRVMVADRGSPPSAPGTPPPTPGRDGGRRLEF